MELSRELLKQFAQIANGNSNKKQTISSYMNATTVVRDGAKFVQIDGSDQLTPVTETMGIQNGDRVLVTIENHQATVIGNYTYPADARTANQAKTDAEKAIQMANTIIATSITVETLEAAMIEAGYLRVAELLALAADVETLEADTIKTKDITAEDGVFSYLSTNSLNASYATITQLEAANAKIDEIEAGRITADEIIAAVANVGYIKATDITASNGSFNYLSSDKLDTKYATISVLEANYATIEQLNASKITADEVKTIIADVGYLKATDITASNGSFNYLSSGKLDAKYATISVLEANYATISVLEANYATITQLNAEVGRIDVLSGDLAGYKTVMAEELLTAKGWMAEGSIGNAQISNISAGKLTSGTINAALVSVAGSNGRLQIIDNTIKISDTNHTRVQIGKDGSGDYTLAVWDASGKLIWDALGATENTIQRAIIRDSMVSSDAAIQALKIDFQSFETALTDQGVSISGTVVQVGDKTLNVMLSEQNQLISDQGIALDSHEARISANEDAISLKVSSSTFDEYKTSVEEDIANAIEQNDPFIVGTHTGNVISWKGDAPFSSLVDGQRITYWLPSTSTSSSGVRLTLTLSGGDTTGAIPCYYSGTTPLSNQYSAGNVLRLTYRENVKIGGSTVANGWWADANYNTDTDTTDRTKYAGVILAKSAISAGRLIVGEGNAYYHLESNVPFDISKPILYSGSIISSGSTGNNNYIMYSGVNLPVNKSGWTGTPYKPVYIVGTLDGKIFTPNDALFTTTEPTSEDGLYYILLGQTNNSTGAVLIPEHPIYKFTNGKFQQAISNFANYSTTAEMNAEINVAKDSILSTVSSTYATISDLTITNNDVAANAEQIEIHEETLTNHDSRISQTENDISLKVSTSEFTSYQETVDGELVKMDSKLSETESSISLMEGKIESKVEQTHIDKSIDNLKIGARNLLRNSLTLLFDAYYFEVGSVPPDDTSRLPSEYQEVEWVQIVNGENLDILSSVHTNVKWSEATKIVAKFQNITSSNDNDILFATWSSESSKTTPYIASRTSKGDTMLCYQSGLTTYSVSPSVSITDVNANEYTIEFTSSSTGDICFGSWYDSTYTHPHKWYYVEIYNGNTLLANFIPCYRKSDNINGFYDLVSGSFYVNSDTISTFTYRGPDVSGVAGYTNQIPISTDADGNVVGLIKDHRYNSSDTLVANTGTDATGFIPVKFGDTVRFKNIMFNPSMDYSGSIYIRVYDANHTIISATSPLNMNNELSRYGDSEVDADNNLTSITLNNADVVSDVAFLRISFISINENPIITVNEEISDTPSTPDTSVLPAEYQEVTYLQAESGVATYINLGFAFDTKAKIYMTCNAVNNTVTSYIFGAAENSGVLRCMVTLQSTGMTYLYGSNGSSFIEAALYNTQGVDSELELILQPGELTIREAETDGASTKTTQAAYTMSSNLYLFAQNYNGSARYGNTRRISKFQYYDKNDTLICDLVPCYRKSDGVCGMYDLVRKTFLTNIGNGADFTKGADVTGGDDSGYTNVLPLAQEYASTAPYVGSDGSVGYGNNKRISSSSPTETYMKDLDGVDTTGLIPAKRGDVLRFKNCNFKVTPSNISYGSYIQGFDNTKVLISGFNVKSNSIDNRIPYVTEGEEVVEVTLEPKEGWAASNVDDVAYVMISTDGLDETSIITINEEITPAALFNLDREYTNGTSGEVISRGYLDDSKAYLNVGYGGVDFYSNACTISNVTENSVTVTEGGVGGLVVAYPIHLPDLATQKYRIKFDYSGTGKCRTYYRNVKTDGTLSASYQIHLNETAGATGSVDVILNENITINEGEGWEWLLIMFGSNTSATKSYTNITLEKV